MSSTLRELEVVSGFRDVMAKTSGALKKKALFAMAEALRESKAVILSANARDMEAAVGSISVVMLDRLRLDEERVEAMARGVEEVAELSDPVGRVVSTALRPNGLRLEKVASPMGVIGIIYESRPNVTSDAAALALMAGSAVVLRSGKEAHFTASAIVEAMHRGLYSVGVPKDVLVLISDTSRESAMELMRAKGLVDLLIPRGGKALISACVENALVPVLETGTGICHGYVDKEADVSVALSIIENGKTSRPSVCNALEVCLVHEEIAEEFLPLLSHRLGEGRKSQGLEPVELRLSWEGGRTLQGFVSASGEDFDTEFLDYILAVKVVASLDEAISHINAHSTGHSEVILTKNKENSGRFTREVDSAAVYVNASTRFTDGGQFGLGCEMGISTQKLHARGPLGLEELCTYKFVITGDGQVRG